jgi:multiple antibiotic resistance protein
MLLLGKYFVLVFSALLPLINPLGSSLVFLGLVGIAPSATYKTLARKIAFNTILFLLAIELLGAALLSFFGISLPILQVAGGFVLAAMGWSLLNEKDASADAARKDIPPEASLSNLQQRTFYPYTFPITAGPGTIVVMLTLSAHASRKLLTESLLAHLGALLAIIALSLLVYLCYAYAPAITKKISPQTAHGIQRVIAFILLCIGVQIAWNGLQTLVLTMLQHR